MAEDNKCVYCGKSITRKVYSTGVLEPVSRFKHRKYCNHACQIRVTKPYLGMKKLNLIGQRFGRLVVLAETEPR